MSAEEYKIIYPTAAVIINALEIDTVDEEAVIGVCFTGMDIQRGYMRWQTMMESPNPYSHEFTDPTITAIVQRAVEAEKETAEAHSQIEADQKRNLELVGDVANREKDIRALQSDLDNLQADYDTVKDLSDGRESKIKNLTRSESRLKKQIENYRNRYRSADSELNWFQRVVKNLFRI